MDTKYPLKILHLNKVQQQWYVKGNPFGGELPFLMCR